MVGENVLQRFAPATPVIQKWSQIHGSKVVTVPMHQSGLRRQIPHPRLSNSRLSIPGLHAPRLSAPDSTPPDSPPQTLQPDSPTVSVFPMHKCGHIIPAHMWSYFPGQKKKKNGHYFSSTKLVFFLRHQRVGIPHAQKLSYFATTKVIASLWHKLVVFPRNKSGRNIQAQKWQHFPGTETVISFQAKVVIFPRHKSGRVPQARKRWYFQACISQAQKGRISQVQKWSYLLVFSKHTSGRIPHKHKLSYLVGRVVFIFLRHTIPKSANQKHTQRLYALPQYRYLVWSRRNAATYRHRTSQLATYTIHC